MSTTTVESRVAAGTATPRLRKNALGFPELLAQSVALISPTMTAVLIIPLAFSIAGDSTWFSYLFATVMLIFAVSGLNQFAKRSSTTGSMYAYVAKGLGAASGVMTGLGAGLVLLLHRDRRALRLHADERAVPVRDRRPRHRHAVRFLRDQRRRSASRSPSRTCACRRC